MTESPSINRDIIGACNSKIHDIDVKIELYKDRIKALKENRKYWIGLAKQIEKLKKHG